MAGRTALVVLTLLGISLARVHPAAAQRSGFFIDVGLGVGTVSSNTTLVGFDVSERESKIGLAASFNMGGVIGPSLELYWANQVLLHYTARQGTDRAVTGVTGVGVGYPLSPDLSIRGAVGLSHQTLSIDEWGNVFDTSNGLGLLAGARYGLGARWALDLDVMYASWNDGAIAGSEEVSLWGASLIFKWLNVN